MSDNLSFQDLYADSVACLGKSDKISEATRAKIKMLQEQKSVKKLTVMLLRLLMNLLPCLQVMVVTLLVLKC